MNCLILSSDLIGHWRMDILGEYAVMDAENQLKSNIYMYICYHILTVLTDTYIYI